MPTAFCATWGSEGPVLGGYAEYDAVPGRTQAVVPYKRPRDGFSAYAAGHTDPHSALGIGSLTGFLAAKHAIEKFGIKAQLKFFGEPPRNCAARSRCTRRTATTTVSYAAISFHPSSFPDFANSCFWDTASLSYWSKIYTSGAMTPSNGSQRNR